MANQLLHGFLNLSRIPKQLIVTNGRGEKGVWIDVSERREPGQYGDTHCIKVWSRETGGVFIGDLKPREIPGQQAAPQQAAAQAQAQAQAQARQTPDSGSLEPQPDDLPF